MDASTNVVCVDQDSLVVKPNAPAIADDDDSDEGMDEGNLLIDMNGSKDEEGEDVHRKSGSKQWGPNSFSTNFSCYFCNEQFRKDYKLKLHLMLNHKNENPDELEKAKEARPGISVSLTRL